MSNRPDVLAEAARKFHENYQQGPDQFNNWIHDKLPVELSAAQKRLTRAVAEHRRVLVIGANGPGKSYAAACLVAAFLHSRKPSTVLATSGTYGKLKRTLCRPVEGLQRDGTVDESPLPGEYKHSPPRIDMDDPEWYFEASRPKDAGELEGTHNEHLLAITEEADKDAVDHDVVESIDSCPTDENDRHLVIANPPTDEANVVYDLMQSDAWHVERMPTWASRNVRVDADEHPGPKIPGLVGLAEVKESWKAWNNEPWPGLEAAKTAHERRDDLDQRWYRRRAGVMPPQSADAHRPFEVDTVRRAYERDGSPDRKPTSSGIDVARSGDRTVMVDVTGDALRLRHAEQGAHHEQQFATLRDEIDSAPRRDVAVDAVGEGSGLADRLDTAFPNVTRFRANQEAAEGAEFRDRWTEGLYHLGEFLRDGAIADTTLREELLTAARVIEYDTTFLASRGADGADVLEATSKSVVKENLGRSPDYLDAALMAVWAASCDSSGSNYATTEDELVIL
jgi:hypothetical protein